LTLTIALAGDTMLGRGVAERLASRPASALFDPELVAAVRGADLLLLNLECCISERGSRWPDPAKPFFFRAPPHAVDALVLLGAGCVTLANNHALDYGPEALADTIEHLRAAGIACVGAGPDVAAARAPVVLEAAGARLGVVAFTDHPAEFAAGPGRPGVAHAPLQEGLPAWVTGTVGALRAETDAVLVTPHWGPNMVTSPLAYVRAAAAGLLEAGATLVAGHSAHVFHGVSGRVLYDLGDFLDDYARDPLLRNDLGLLFLVALDERGPSRLEALPLELEYCHTRLARGAAARWVERRFRRACAELGTSVRLEGGRLVAELR
jgi:poly-gamma-glutamate capsule biosynthesis protein CapA/YwtB (metallophosphatase superfamily)